MLVREEVVTLQEFDLFWVDLQLMTLGILQILDNLITRDESKILAL